MDDNKETLICDISLLMQLAVEGPDCGEEVNRMFLAICRVVCNAYVARDGIESTPKCTQAAAGNEIA